MDAQEFRALSAAQVARAEALAGRFPVSREVLTFQTVIARFQVGIVDRVVSVERGREELSALREELVDVVVRHGPEELRRAASEFCDADSRRSVEDYWHQRDTESPTSLLARIVLQPWAATTDDVIPSETRGEAGCPRCSHPPQVAVLRPQGDGNALSLICSLCFHEWESRRGHCPGCGELHESRLAYYSADPEHLKLQVCDTCRRYLHQIDLGRDPQAIPVVDELLGLSLDVWAREKGYRKLQVNVAGI